jgi:hypothetical protein
MTKQNIDWKLEIVSTVMAQTEICRLDKEGIYNYNLPKLAATPEAISHCQQIIGFEFDEDYAEFLTYADGWDAFAVGDGDLFGTGDYLGSDRFIETQKFLKDHAGESGLDVIEVSIEDVFPICMSRFDIDLYIMRKRHVPGVSRVYWFAGYLIDEFPSFLDFFQSMRAYNLQRLETMKAT